MVAAAGRQVAEGRALRADTKRRGAPFTKTRVTRDAKASGPVVETRKRFALLSIFGDRPRLTVGTDPGGLFTNLHELTRIFTIIP